MGTGFVMNQPRGMGDDFFIPSESNIYEDVNDASPYVAPVLSPQPVSTSVWDQLFSSLTKPGVVNASLNKWVFGSTSPIPTSTNVYPPGYVPPVAGSSIIAGVPDTYLMVGAAAVALLILTSKKGRR